MIAADRPRRWRRGLPCLVAVALAVIYVAWAPHTADLAAQTARAELFRRSGYVPYWSGWYAGIATPSYSLTTPPLLGWLGPVWLGAAAIIATPLVAVPLVRTARRPVAGASLIVVAAGLDVASGRTTFAVGAVVALLVLLAGDRGRWIIAGSLAVLTTVTSPVAGFLLLVVAAMHVSVDRGRRRTGWAIGVGVVAALGLLAWLSQGDGSGYQPFTRSSLLMAVGTAAVVIVTPVGRRVRAAAAITVVMLLVVYAVHSPVGANATRLAVLGAAPAIVCAARGRLMMGLGLVLAALLPISQLHNDLVAASADDHDRGFVAALQAQLRGNDALNGHRVELVDTATHWPSTYLLADVAIARGWERQVDESRNPIFYGRAPLTAATYRAFLDRNAVSVVAVARDVPLDWGTRSEAALIARGLPYLRLAASVDHWQVYDVVDPVAIVAGPATVVAGGDTGVRLRVPAPGRYPVRMRWSPYLTVSGGRVVRAADDSIVLDLASPGVHDLHAVWQLP